MVTLEFSQKKQSFYFGYPDAPVRPSKYNTDRCTVAQGRRDAMIRLCKVVSGEIRGKVVTVEVVKGMCKN